MRIILLILFIVFSSLCYSNSLLSQNIRVDYSTYLGGYICDEGKDIALDSENHAYITGKSLSPDFPVLNPYQATRAGGYDGFVSKFSSSGSTLIFSTFLGGSQEDCGNSICLDEQSQIYIVGFTKSEDYPTKNPYQSNYQENEHTSVISMVFVSKFSSSGSSLIYSTFLGGNIRDIGNDIRVDSSGCAYVTGSTTSGNFPLKNPYQSQTHSPRGSAFVSKFSSSGSSLIYSTYLGGSNWDKGGAIAIDQKKDVFVAGWTRSKDFPTKNPYQATREGPVDLVTCIDIFVSKLSASGSDLLYSTYLGGYEKDYGTSITVDSEGCLYLTGQTTSEDYPLKNSYQISYAGRGDAFVTKLSSSGSDVLSSTYLGGEAYDYGIDICLISGKMICLGGNTESSNFPTRNCYQANRGGFYSLSSGGSDAFVSTLSSSGSVLFYSTYYGGEDNDNVGGIAVDAQNRVYIAGSTASSSFPTANSYQSTYPSTSASFAAFVSRLVFTPTRISVQSGDYNGDGASNIAIFRPDIGLWSVKDLGRVYYGMRGDNPVSGDFNGDGYTDVAIYRSISGLWAIKNISRCYFGSSDQIPVPEDYDGDGCCDIAVYDPSAGVWSIKGISCIYYGTEGDQPIPSDYTGDGTAEIAVFRSEKGFWAIRGETGVYFGREGDIPVPANYTWYGGKSKNAVEIAVFRPWTGLWAIKGGPKHYFGMAFDIPIPGDYRNVGIDDIAVYRNYSGLWAIKGVSRIYYGSVEDVPVTK